jgi:hypothetical protein
MPVLSYVHQLFNTEQCQAYIHTLRWKDRLLQCPRCQSQDIDPWGTYHYRPGCKRYWCNGCNRTFNDLTNTLLHQTHIPHPSDGDPRYFLAAFFARTTNPPSGMVSSHERRYTKHLRPWRVVWVSCSRLSKRTKSNICPL